MRLPTPHGSQGRLALPTSRCASLLAGVALPEAPRGFVRFLVESRLLAIVLGVGALVALGVWIAWQLAGLSEHAAGEPPTDGDARHGP